MPPARARASVGADGAERKTARSQTAGSAAAQRASWRTSGGIGSREPSPRARQMRVASIDASLQGKSVRSSSVWTVTAGDECSPARVDVQSRQRVGHRQGTGDLVPVAVQSNLQVPGPILAHRGRMDIRIGRIRPRHGFSTAGRFRIKIGEWASTLGRRLALSRSRGLSRARSHENLTYHMRTLPARRADPR